MQAVQFPYFLVTLLLSIFCDHHKFDLSHTQIHIWFDVHVTVHRDKFLIIKPTRCTTFSNLFLEWNSTLNVQESVHRRYLPLDIFPTRCNITQFIYFCKTDLHVSGGISTHHQEHIQLYLQYLVLVNRYCYLPLLWKSWSWSECRVAPTLPQ